MRGHPSDEKQPALKEWSNECSCEKVIPRASTRHNDECRDDALVESSTPFSEPRFDLYRHPLLLNSPRGKHSPHRRLPLEARYLQ